VVTLVDSNVILDVVTEDPQWLEWSGAMLEDAAENGELAINAMVYAEVGVRFDRIEDLEAAVPSNYFRREAIPLEAAFLAGKCFQKYRSLGGQRRSPLPDFFIGAHAAVAGMTLLTRDARRYRSYFPRLRIVSP
jgi:predicted nucleic acid-binding protein